MSRTTLDIEAPILEQVKRVQEREGGSMGQVVSRLLAEAIAREKAATPAPRPFEWISQPMGARVDLLDKEALYAALDDESE